MTNYYGQSEVVETDIRPCIISDWRQSEVTDNEEAEQVEVSRFRKGDPK